MEPLGGEGLELSRNWLSNLTLLVIAGLAWGVTLAPNLSWVFYLGAVLAVGLYGYLLFFKTSEESASEVESEATVPLTGGAVDSELVVSTYVDWMDLSDQLKMHENLSLSMREMKESFDHLERSWRKYYMLPVLKAAEWEVVDLTQIHEPDSQKFRSISNESTYDNFAELYRGRRDSTPRNVKQFQD